MLREDTLDMPLNIVQVEDDSHLQTIFKAALDAIALDVALVQFNNTDEAKAYIEANAQNIDLFVLDVRVPGKLNGVQLASVIRKYYRETPIVITSAYTRPKRENIAAIRAEYLPKPWHILELVERLQMHTNTIPLDTAPAISADDASPVITEEVTGAGFQPLLNLTKHSLKGATAVMALIQPSGNLGSLMGLPDSWQRTGEEVLLQSILSHVAQTGTAVISTDVHQQIRGDSAPQIGACIAVPIRSSSGTLLGVLGSTSPLPHQWSVDTAEHLAATAALLVQAQLDLAALERRNHDLYTYGYTIAHDLKSPLGAVIAYADLSKALWGDQLPSDLLSYLSNIRSTADHMMEMISQLMVLTKLDDPTETAEPVDIGAAVEDALMRLGPLLEQRGIILEIDDNLPSALGHEIWVTEVFANFLSNAVKYIGEDNPSPTIRVHGFRVGAFARYEVEDNGVGVADEDQPRLFEMFTRLNTVRVEGTGLGLAIVQKIITRLGGTVGMHSRNGQGSVFWFTLPAAE
jgi:signal transduction histidine kinase